MADDELVLAGLFGIPLLLRRAKPPARQGTPEPALGLTPEEVTSPEELRRVLRGMADVWAEAIVNRLAPYITGLREVLRPSAPAPQPSPLITYGILTLDLSTARDNEEVQIGVTEHISVEKCDGTAYVRLDRPNADAINIGQYVFLELPRPITRIFVTNTAQPGKELVLALGHRQMFRSRVISIKSKTIDPDGAEIYMAADWLQYILRCAHQQDLSADVFDYTTSIGDEWGLVAVMLHFNSAVSETVTVTFKSKTGSAYDTVLDQVDLSSNTDYVYRPSAPFLPLQAGDEINVHVTNDNVTASVVASMTLLGISRS